MTNDDLHKFSELLDTKLEPIKKTLDEHGKILKSHSKSLNSLKKTQDVMLNMLDIEQMNQRKRIKRIENHLNIPST